MSNELNLRHVRRRERDRYTIWRAMAEKRREQAMKAFSGQYVDLDPLPPRNKPPKNWAN